jgi:hypothetical protein
MFARQAAQHTLLFSSSFFCKRLSECFLSVSDCFFIASTAPGFFAGEGVEALPPILRAGSEAGTLKLCVKK